MSDAASSTSSIRFFFNGLKVGNGQLYKGWLHFDDGQRYGAPAVAPHISFSAKGYGHLPKEVLSAFVVRNDTDLHTDYFDHDRFDVSIAHPLFPAAAAAKARGLARDIARCEKKGATEYADQYRRELAKLTAVVASLASEAA